MKYNQSRNHGNDYFRKLSHIFLDDDILSVSVETLFIEQNINTHKNKWQGPALKSNLATSSSK